MKKVLITGAGTGFGHEVAMRLARKGFDVIATVEIYDRQEACVELGLPNIALADYHTSENYKVDECPMCRPGMAITRF